MAGSRESKALSAVEAMQLAIAEGKKGAGWVSPNPLVGCVILDEKHRLLSTGYHKKIGGPHAEIEALKGVSDEQLEGAHIYVTLEPCANEGKTPSCAKHLATLPIASVTYGVRDPNPLTNGRGAEILKEAEIDVFDFSEIPDNPTKLTSELEELAEVFLYNMRKQRPFVSLKVATSLDGQMGLKTKESGWITNELSRDHVHFLRATHDAVLVGRGTIDIDNPRLNIRHPKFKDKKNKVIVLDGDGQLLGTIKDRLVATVHAPENIIVVTKPGVHVPPEGKAFTHLQCPLKSDGVFDLDRLLEELYRKGICSVMVEGGSNTYRGFFLQKQIQRVILFQAPILLGHENGLPWTQGLVIPTMKDKIVLKDVTASFFGSDLMTSARLA